MVSTGGNCAQRQRRRRPQHHPGAHATDHAQVPVAGVGAADRRQHVPAAQGLRPRHRLLPRNPRALPGRDEGGLRALEVCLDHLPAEPPGTGEEVLRGAGRVLPGSATKSPTPCTGARRMAEDDQGLRRRARLLREARRSLSQLLLRRAGAQAAGADAGRSRRQRGRVAACRLRPDLRCDRTGYRST